MIHTKVTKVSLWNYDKSKIIQNKVTRKNVNDIVTDTVLAFDVCVAFVWHRLYGLPAFNVTPMLMGMNMIRSYHQAGKVCQFYYEFKHDETNEIHFKNMDWILNQILVRKVNNKDKDSDCVDYVQPATGDMVKAAARWIDTCNVCILWILSPREMWLWPFKAGLISSDCAAQFLTNIESSSFARPVAARPDRKRHFTLPSPILL